MRWIILALLFLAYVVNYADKAIIGYAAEPLMNELSLNSAQWGIIGSSFFWVFAIASLLGGTWSDRFGTSRLIVIMLIGWTILQFGSYAIMSLPMLILYRVLLGGFEGPFTPTALSHTSKWFPPELRGTAFSILISGASIGGVVSAPVLIPLIEKFGWRVTFAMMGVLSLVIVILWLLVERKNKQHNPVTQTEVKKLKWSDIAIVLRNPACFLTLFMSLAALWQTAWMLVWLPMYLTKVAKLEPMHMAYVIAGSGLAGIVLVLLISSFSDRIFRKTQNYNKSRVWVSGICTIIGGLSFALVPILPNSFSWLFVALFVTKACNYTNTAMGLQILIKLMPERSGFMASIFSFVTNIGSILAPIVTGQLIQAAGNNAGLGYHISIYFISVLLVLAAILFLSFVRIERTSVAVPSKLDTV